MGALSEMARRGRKRRKAGYLGDEVAQPAVNYAKMAGEQPHRVWLPKELRTDARAATLLGCLNLIHRPADRKTGQREVGITDEQAEAGRLYAHVIAQYRGSIGGPVGAVGVGRGYPCDPEGNCIWEPNECECYRRQQRYMELYEALARAGRKATVAVNNVAVWQRGADIKHLRCGLDALARYVGLTAGRKMRYGGNTH